MPKKVPTGTTRQPRNKTAATIYDVAARAGVSKTTVSRVLNGEKNVNEKTLATVQRAMKALHYRPNKAARSLASQTGSRIGLIFNNPSVAYFNELMIGALESSGRNDAQLIVDKSEAGNPTAAQKAVRGLVKSGIDGMLLTAPLSQSTSLIRSLIKRGIAVVGVATGKFRGDIPCVGIDDFAAAYEMTEYLIGLGHARIGFIKGHPDHTSSQGRYLGFAAAIRDAGSKVAAPVVAQGSNSFRSGLDAANEILQQPETVTAIFAGNDDMASATLAVAHRKGLNVPKDLSVAGFDDTVAASVWPPLTTIRQPIFEIGANAIELIAENIRLARAHRKLKQQNCLIPHQLIVRESTAPPQS